MVTISQPALVDEELDREDYLLGFGDSVGEQRGFFSGLHEVGSFRPCGLVAA